MKRAGSPCGGLCYWRNGSQQQGQVPSTGTHTLSEQLDQQKIRTLQIYDLAASTWNRASLASQCGHFYEVKQPELFTGTSS